MNNLCTGYSNQRSAVLPAIDVLEDANGITLLADLPGVPREQLKLDIDGQRLLIEAEPKGWADDRQTLIAESRPQLYRRSFVLSKELDTAAVSAELSAGVLRVRIPKAAHAQPRRVSVQVQ